MTTGLKNFFVIFLLASIFFSLISNPANAAATSTSRIIYHHTDHLGGITVSTDKSGKVIEVNDYLPYGEQWFRYNLPNQAEQRKYAGYEFDPATRLNYLNRRYYQSQTGRFISQDPLFWNFTNQIEIAKELGLSQEAILSDPQLLNAYSYARNNPLIFTDRNGEIIESPIDLALVGYRLYKLQQAIESGDPQQVKIAVVNLSLDSAGLMIPGVTGLGFLNRGKQTLQTADKAKDAAQALKTTTPQQLKQFLATVKNKAADAFTVANQGGKHAGTYKKYLDTATKEIQKGIKSFEKNINLHMQKIITPEKFDSNWNKLTLKEQQGQLNHWKQEIISFAEQRNILKGILKEKGIR